MFEFLLRYGACAPFFVMFIWILVAQRHEQEEMLHRVTDTTNRFTRVRERDPIYAAAMDEVDDIDRRYGLLPPKVMPEIEAAVRGDHAPACSCPTCFMAGMDRAITASYLVPLHIMRPDPVRRERR